MDQDKPMNQKAVNWEEALLKLKKMKKIKKSEKVQLPPKVEIWVGFEEALRNLYGKSEHPVSEMSVSSWKKLLLKLARTIKSYVKHNVNSDGLHRFWLQHALEKLERAPKHRLYNTEFILGLIELVFNLLGHFPENYEKDTWPRNREEFSLTRYRILTYRQSFQQKVNVIFRSSGFGELSGFQRYSRELLRKKRAELKSSEKFLDWYKSEYPDIYTRLF